METKLLYRSSRDNFDKNTLSDIFTNNAPTITIIHNEHDRIFGAYTSKCKSKSHQDMADPNAFLFGVRPKLIHIPLFDGHKVGKYAMWMPDSRGASFGEYAEIIITHPKDDDGQYAEGNVLTLQFHFSPQEVCGVNNFSNFKIQEYEIFTVSID